MSKLLPAALVVLIGTANTALSHAVLVEVKPPTNASIAGPDVEIQLRFNSRIDAARSALKLVLPDGSVRPLPMRQQPSPDRLVGKAEGMKAGHYALWWQVLAADGHITRGEVPFDVR